MIYLRRLSQLLFLILFNYLILATVNPESSLIPVNLFFITDPLIAIISIIADRTFVFVLTASLVVILVTIFLGRAYCGWVCPLGTTIDIFNRLFLWWKKKQYFYPNLRQVKFLILVVIIVTALLGVNVVGWFDPTAIAFKSYALVIYPFFHGMAQAISDNWGLYQTSHHLTDLGPIQVINTGKGPLLGGPAVSFQYSLLSTIYHGTKSFDCGSLA